MRTWLGVLVWAVMASASDFVQRLEPVDFMGTDYYLSGGSSGTSSAMLEDLQRGHEGIIIKLNEVTKSLKEDELKLNNIFYKLGRHETDLEGVSTNMQRLSTESRRTEAKLNKHAFNVDFLRRKVEVLQRDMEGKEQVEVQVAAVRAIMDRLDDRLTGALARLGLVENTTKTLEKRSAPHYENIPSSYFMNAADRPPTLTVYPESRQGTCKPEWEQVGHGCYWFGGEELTFPEAVASCVRHGGHLLTLTSPGTQLKLLLEHLQANTVYWTSGTDAFNRGNWVFMMTAQPVMPLHWVTSENSTSSSHHNHRCAGLSRQGLTKRGCTHRLPYICHIL